MSKNWKFENFIAFIQETIFIKRGLVFMSSMEFKGEVSEMYKLDDHFSILFIVRNMFLAHDLFVYNG